MARWQTQSILNYIEQMKTDLQNAVPEATGNLRESITTKIETSKTGYSVDFYMSDYAVYQDKGVNGVQKNWGSPYTFSKMPPARVFDRWMVVKGIAPRDSRGKLLPRKQAGWMIARSVFNKGLKPHNFIERNVDNKLEGLADLTMTEIWYELRYKIEDK